MGYALATLWHDRSRYLPGIGAVAFSAVLIALQCGLLLGLFSITSIPIDHTRADIWIGSPEVLSVDLGRPIMVQPNSSELTVYLLARCRNPADAESVVRSLKSYDDMSAFTSSEFSFHSRLHWLTKTRAGGALGYAALLGLLVGAVVTSQT